MVISYGCSTYIFFKAQDNFDCRGDLRAEEAVLLHILRIISMGLGQLGSAHLLSMKKPLKFSAMTGNSTRATKRTDSEMH